MVHNSSQLGDLQPTGQRMSSAPVFEHFRNNKQFLHSRFPGNKTEHLQSRIEYAENMDRSVLATAIQKTLPRENWTSQQREHVRALLDKKALAVVTGQQCGLLGGPLYSLYKAATAVAQARQLSADLGRKVVPVFWIEDNDHDVHEIASVAQIADGNVLQYQFYECVPEHRTIAAAWNIDQTLHTKLLDTVSSWRGPFAQETQELLTACYAEGASVSEAFTKLMHTFLGEAGVVFVSARHLRESGAFESTLSTFVSKSEESNDAYQTAVLDLASFGVEPSADSARINVFGVYENKRYRLGEYQGDVVMRETKHIPISQTGVSLAPNVMTRNVCQDAVLPSIMYVSGPGEIAYQSLLKEQYALANIPMPMFHERISAVLCDARTAKLSNVDGVLEMLFSENGVKEYENSVFEHQVHEDVERMLDTIRFQYRDAQRRVGRLDPTLEAVVQRHARKAEKSFQDIQQRVRRTQREKHRQALKHFVYGQTMALPLGKPQERIATCASLLPTLGVEGVRQMLTRLIEAKPKDQVFVHV